MLNAKPNIQTQSQDSGIMTQVEITSLGLNWATQAPLHRNFYLTQKSDTNYIVKDFKLSKVHNVILLSIKQNCPGPWEMLVYGWDHKQNADCPLGDWTRDPHQLPDC